MHPTPEDVAKKIVAIMKKIAYVNFILHFTDDDDMDLVREKITEAGYRIYEPVLGNSISSTISAMACDKIALFLNKKVSASLDTGFNLPGFVRITMPCYEEQEKLEREAASLLPHQSRFFRKLEEGKVESVFVGVEPKYGKLPDPEPKMKNNFMIFADDDEVHELKAKYARLGNVDHVPIIGEGHDRNTLAYYLQRLDVQLEGNRIQTLIVPYSKRRMFSQGFRLSHTEIILTRKFTRKILKKIRNSSNGYNTLSQILERVRIL